VVVVRVAGSQSIEQSTREDGRWNRPVRLYLLERVLPPVGCGDDVDSSAVERLDGRRLSPGAESLDEPTAEAAVENGDLAACPACFQLLVYEFSREGCFLDPSLLGRCCDEVQMPVLGGSLSMTADV
jgi:hypothetical protein